MTLLQVIAIWAISCVVVFGFLYRIILGDFRNDDPMSPDEEYLWLTGECELTHDEALEMQGLISRSEG